MTTTVFLRAFLIVTIFSVFLTNTMDKKTPINGASQNSNTVTTNQQVGNQAQQPGLLGSASRYVWKYTADGSRAIIGLGDETEKENTVAIYRSAKEKTGKETMPKVLKKQLVERQQLTQEFVLSLMEKYNDPNYIPQDIKDGLTLCSLSEIDAILTTDMHSKLKNKLTDLIKALIEEYTSMVNELENDNNENDLEKQPSDSKKEKQPSDYEF